MLDIAALLCNIYGVILDISSSSIQYLQFLGMYFFYYASQNDIWEFERRRVFLRW